MNELASPKTNPPNPIPFPTVGRLVRYKYQVHAQAPVADVPALICYIHDPAIGGLLVNIAYWDINGFQQSAGKVKHGDEPGQWHWPKIEGAPSSVPVDTKP